MNNPFSRLKHYRVNATDPQTRATEQQENHATECLAACLVFSSKIREAFLEYLLRDGKAIFRGYMHEHSFPLSVDFNP